MNEEINKITARLIYEDIKKAYNDKSPKNMANALTSIKRILDDNGDINKDIVKELSQYGISLVWNKVEHDHKIEKCLGVRYKNIALEIE